MLVLMLVTNADAVAQPGPGLEFHARDDIGRAVPSYILVDNAKVGRTDDQGRYVFDDRAKCPSGKPVTAEPRESVALYLQPSTTGYCQIEEAPVRLTLSRRRLLRNAMHGYLSAVAREDWAGAAHAGNEIIVLSERHNQPLDSAFVRGGVYGNLARSLDFDPDASTVEDPAQKRQVVSPAFADRIGDARLANDLPPGYEVDVSLLQSLSGKRSGQLLYADPTDDFQAAFDAAKRRTDDSVSLDDVGESVEAIRDLAAEMELR